MSRQIKYIEYNGQPVISARDLYAYLLDGTGTDVTGWVKFCSDYDLMVEGEDFYKVNTNAGHPDVLMVATCAAVMVANYKTPKTSQAYAYIRSLNVRGEAPDENEIRDQEDTSITIAQAAKIIDPKLGPQALYKFLKDSRILMNCNVPYQNYVNGGYFNVIRSEYHRPDGSAHHYAKTYVTALGLDWIKKILQKNKELVTA